MNAFSQMGLVPAAAATTAATTGVGSSILGYHGPDEIAQMQSGLKMNVGIIDAAVRQCAAVDDLTRAGWGVFYTYCLDWSNSSVPFAVDYGGLAGMYNEGQALFAQKDEWVKKLNAFGCNVPLVQRPAQESMLDKLTTTAAVVAGAVVAVAVVYGIVKVTGAVAETSRAIRGH
jgi:hypothetical protein